MTVQRAFGIFFLGSAIVYAIVMMRSIRKDREWLMAAPGKIGVLMPAEGILFFLCSMGLPDFVMNTILCQNLHLTTPEHQPDCNIAATIVPSGIISFLYLSHAGAVDAPLLVTFLLCVVTGCFAGTYARTRMPGDGVRRAMILLMGITFLCLIVKMVLSAGTVTEAVSLRGWRLGVIGAAGFGAGFINMLGIPAKPLTATVALLLGLSPITTLALTLGAVPFSGVVGGVHVARARNYNPKLILSAMTAGSIAAACGCMLAVSIPAPVLNGIILAAIGLAIVSLVRK